MKLGVTVCQAVSILVLLCLPLAAADTGPALQIRVQSARHPIDPRIYGINFVDESLARELRLPVTRWGGNATTRYNWKNNMANRASDWFFENLPEALDDPAALPDKSAVNAFIDQNMRTGTAVILTVPLVAWTPKDRGRNCGFSVAKYGAQQRTDQWWPDCGNGIKPDGTQITGNDPHDTSQEITPDFVQEWMRYLISRYGSALKGGIQFYNLDNEPMLWNSTHRDVHPLPTSYDEMKDRTYAYAAAIKQTDPDAKTLGPVLWGWNAYFYSALDTAPDQWWNKPPADRNAHGGVPFVAWYLQQMRNYERERGVRILDYLDLHIYPQPTGVSGSEQGDAALQALRLRSTRALWDPAFRDPSWINDYIRLIPRMREWVSSNYPGTKLAITEYNWGALGYLNGALAQADVLGIFGREQLELASLWGPQQSDAPWAYAFRIYRNYDGSGGGFGDVSVQAESADQEKLSVYAAQRSSDAALTLVIINKSTADLTSTVSIDGFSPAGPAQVFQYSAANLRAILPNADQTFNKSGFTATFPASSITLFIAPAAPADLSTSLIFPQVAAGGGYATTFTITNTGGAPASGILNLTDQEGNPLEVTVTGAASNTAAMVGTTGHSFSLSLQPGASWVSTLGRPGAGDAGTGWAKVDSSGGSLSGVATFQYADDRGMKSIAGVLSSQLLDSAAIPLDNDGSRSRFAGFAVANPGTADIHVTVTTLREDGNVADRLQPTELNPLGPQKQVARFLHEYLASRANFRGSMILTAEPGEKFAVVALSLNQGLFTAVPVLPKSSPWKLVWSDEFDGPDNSSADGSKWVTETGGGGWGNQELETYTSRIENAHVEDGALAITAFREMYTGTDGITRNYTSARLKTQGKLSRKYGRFEARLKLPSGQGMWPAFWMLGDDIGTAGWPACGEIDIMENIGREPSIVHGTIHGPGYSGAGGIGASYSLSAGRKLSDAYHIFAVEWEPGEIRWIVDGIVYQTRRPANLPAGRNWVFDKSFFLILNLAVGGSWPGNPDSTTVFPQKYLVDYVRVYERVP